MQDKIILGILQYRDMTSYDVKKAIESSTTHFYNASMGSIHPALKKLENTECTTANSVIENGRTKKYYSITEKGRETFSEWLNEGLPLGKFKDETLVRLFFFGNLTTQEQSRHIASHITKLDQQITILEELKTQFSGINITDEMKTHANFQIATLDFGLNYSKFSRDWYQKFLTENIKGHKGP